MQRQNQGLSPLTIFFICVFKKSYQVCPVALFCACKNFEIEPRSLLMRNIISLQIAFWEVDRDILGTLMLSMLGKKFSRQHQNAKKTICMKCQSLFSGKNKKIRKVFGKNKKSISKCCLLKFLPSMLEDYLHEIQKPIFWEKIRKYFEMLSAEMFTHHARL